MRSIRGSIAVPYSSPNLPVQQHAVIRYEGIVWIFRVNIPNKLKCLYKVQYSILTKDIEYICMSHCLIIALLDNGEKKKKNEALREFSEILCSHRQENAPSQKRKGNWVPGLGLITQANKQKTLYPNFWFALYVIEVWPRDYLTKWDGKQAQSSYWCAMRWECVSLCVHLNRQ